MKCAPFWWSKTTGACADCYAAENSVKGSKKQSYERELKSPVETNYSRKWLLAMDHKIMTNSGEAKHI